MSGIENFIIFNMGYFAHDTAIIDNGCLIGEGTKIWHFSHLMSGCILGSDCNIGQNVLICPSVVLGNNVKVQNNVSLLKAPIKKCFFGSGFFNFKSGKTEKKSSRRPARNLDQNSKCL